jgi:hypothetical protein
MNRDEARAFFRRKNERRRLVTDPRQRFENREMGRLLSLRLWKKKDRVDQSDRPARKEAA